MHLLVCLFLIAFSFTALGSRWAEFEQDLLQFNENPSEFLNSPPRKSFHFTKFSNQEILSLDFLEEKLQQRRACTRGTKPEALYSPMALPTPEDNVENLLQGKLKTKNIFELDSMNIKKGEVSKLPWSGDYWPIAKGILGRRPFDESFTKLESWKDRYDYSTKNPMHKIIENENFDFTRLLSPSEKYELFTGDLNSFLTQQMWLEGKAYHDDNGEVEEWMGICHGWAPASYMMDGPKKTITLKSKDQTAEFKMYPDELKGLASYLWATSPFETVHIGGRCNEKEPEKDENGRIIDEKCFDSNPATWHLAITHSVGMEGKSFIIDATYDYEVWNQPVAAYQFTYFNMNTMKTSADLKTAITKRDDLKNDIFLKYRNPESTKTVGVAMRLGYIVERNVDDHETEPPPYSSVVWVDYLYDLELNDEGEILGGEWYSNIHPDFLWTPLDKAFTRSRVDPYLEDSTWSGEGEIPEKWTEGSIYSHYHFKQLLTPIINKLMEMAQ